MLKVTSESVGASRTGYFGPRNLKNANMKVDYFDQLQLVVLIRLLIIKGVFVQN